MNQIKYNTSIKRQSVISQRTKSGREGIRRGKKRPKSIKLVSVKEGKGREEEKEGESKEQKARRE